MIGAFVPERALGQPAAERGEINASMFDSWSAVHALSGVTLGLLGVPLGWTIVIASTYEVIEYAHEWPRGSILFGSKRPESALNIAADMLLLLGGWYVATRLAR